MLGPSKHGGAFFTSRETFGFRPGTIDARFGIAMLDTVRKIPEAPNGVVAAKSQRTAIVVTRDGGLFERVLAASPARWNVEAVIDGTSSRRWLALPDIRVAIIDDEALLESERGWLLDRIHRDAPDAAIVYIASKHGPDVERAARSRGVLCYLARPLEADRLECLLHGLFARG